MFLFTPQGLRLGSGYIKTAMQITAGTFLSDCSLTNQSYKYQMGPATALYDFLLRVGERPVKCMFSRSRGSQAFFFFGLAYLFKWFSYSLLQQCS